MSEPSIQPALSPAATQPGPDRFTEKARTLIALLGREGVRSLAEEKLPADLSQRLMRAIGRIDAERQGGEPSGPAHRDVPPADPVPRPDPFAAHPAEGSRMSPADPERVEQLIALHARPADLTAEHPAVLAILLRRQSPALKTATLRALPGATARRVLRHLDDLAARS